MNRTLFDKVRCILVGPSVAYIDNRTPSRFKTPEEIWFGNLPDYSRSTSNPGHFQIRSETGEQIVQSRDENESDHSS